MKMQGVLHKEQIPPACLAEAGVWIARLHGDDRDREVEAGFREWLHADPLHARAFELTTEVWDDSQNLRRVVPFAHEVPVERGGKGGLWLAGAAAAALVLVAVGVVFYQGMGVATGIGEQRLLTLEDGTRVYLNTETRVVVDYDRQTRRVTLKGGEALFDVARKPGWPFIVQAGERRVEALGTTFVVRYEAQRTAVTLVEGKVAVTSLASSQDAGSPMVLTPGQRLTLTPQGPVKIDAPVLDQAIAWRRGQVVLDDTPLSSAVAEMNRYSTTQLVIQHPEAASLLVNGLFQAGDSGNFANAVAQTYGLRVVSENGAIVLEGLPQSVQPPPR